MFLKTLPAILLFTPLALSTALPQSQTHAPPQPSQISISSVTSDLPAGTLATSFSAPRNTITFSFEPGPLDTYLGPGYPASYRVRTNTVRLQLAHPRDAQFSLQEIALQSTVSLDDKETGVVNITVEYVPERPVGVQTVFMGPMVGYPVRREALGGVWSGCGGVEGKTEVRARVRVAATSGSSVAKGYIGEVPVAVGVKVVQMGIVWRGC